MPKHKHQVFWRITEQTIGFCCTWFYGQLKKEHEEQCPENKCFGHPIDSSQFEKDKKVEIETDVKL